MVRTPRPAPFVTPRVEPSDEHDDAEPSLRTSLMIARTKKRTTVAEVTNLAERLSVYAETRVPFGRKLALIGGLVLAIGMLLATALVTGSSRRMWWVGAFATIAVLFLFGSVRVLRRAARRAGSWELPGGPLVWLGIGWAAVLALSAGATWSLTEATARLAVVALPIIKKSKPKPPAPEPSAVLPPEQWADRDIKRGGHVGVAGGVLHVPRSFHSPDGSFDLLLHFHGNTELVQESLSRANVNALVHIVNAGIGSGPYEARYMLPTYFEGTIRLIEERALALGLENARVRRIALSSWSAGYGALRYIIATESQRERIDAVLLMDSMHVGYRDEETQTLEPLKLAPFLAFAELAAKGEKLMVLTHSSIRTIEYASTTQGADALLEAVGMEREPAKPPAHVEFAMTMADVPKANRRWLDNCTEARKGLFTVLGCTGNTPEDHIAHLVQMKETVLPPLVERWSH
jgi:hypothetical protein